MVWEIIVKIGKISRVLQVEFYHLLKLSRNAIRGCALANGQAVAEVGRAAGGSQETDGEGIRLTLDLVNGEKRTVKQESCVDAWMKNDMAELMGTDEAGPEVIEFLIQDDKMLTVCIAMISHSLAKRRIVHDDVAFLGNAEWVRRAVFFRDVLRDAVNVHKLPRIIAA